METNIKTLLNDLRLESSTTRGRVNLYFSLSIYREFREVCGDVAVSRVIERFMKEMIKQNQEKDNES